MRKYNLELVNTTNDLTTVDVYNSNEIVDAVFMLELLSRSSKYEYAIIVNEVCEDYCDYLQEFTINEVEDLHHFVNELTGGV